MTLEEEDHVFIMTLDLGGGGEQLIPWNWIHYFSLCPLLSLAIIILMMMMMLMMMMVCGGYCYGGFSFSGGFSYS